MVIDGLFPTVHRNLALAYYNKLQSPEKALQALETAFSLQQSDARVLYELDQLYKKISYTQETRLVNLEKHFNLVKLRDDLFIDYVTLLNQIQ